MVAVRLTLVSFAMLFTCLRMSDTALATTSDDLSPRLPAVASVLEEQEGEGDSVDPPGEGSSEAKDWWDKAAVVSQFFGGVVLAVVGLAITYTIQRTQIRTSQDMTKAQIVSADVRAAAERRLQHGQLTAQLVDSLTSDSASTREIALVALRESVPEQIYTAVARIAAQGDSSTQVRQTAIQQLGHSRDRTVAAALTEIATDDARPQVERELAVASASRVSVASIPPTATVVIASGIGAPNQRTADGNVPSIFTGSLLAGLSGEAADSGGVITAQSLYDYMREDIAKRSLALNLPFSSPLLIASSFGDDPRISGPQLSLGEMVGIVVGVSEYADDRIPNLPDARSGAIAVHELWERLAIGEGRVELIIDQAANREGVMSALQAAVSRLPADALLAMYFSGHALLSRNGEMSLLLNDSSVDMAGSLVSIAELKAGFDQAAARMRLIVLDGYLPRILQMSK